MFAGWRVAHVQVPSLSSVCVTITGEKPPETITQTPAAWELDVLAISPEGKRVAYVAAPETPVVNPSSPSGSQPNQLQVIAFDGGTLMRQFDWPASAWRPRWAPRGDAIDYILTLNGVSNIWVQNCLAVPRNKLRISSRDRFSTLTGRVTASNWR